MKGFFSTLEQRCRSAGSLLCVGIDPRAENPMEARAGALRLIETTAPAAAAFKPNAGFFEALGPAGVEVLVEVIAAVPDEIPVILDAKRGDIASTADAYARACFEVAGAGSVTLSPYLGRDAIDPFLAYPDRGVWVLARTSNPGAAEVQDQALPDGTTVAEAVAAAAAGWAGPDRLGLVAGATAPLALAAVRRAAPEHWILAPGVGAQGGSVDAAAAGLRDDLLGVLVPVSRGIANSADPAAAARDLRDALRTLKPSRTAPRAGSLAVRLFEAGCVALGEFTLRSGEVSPIYVDVRRLSGSPELLREAATAIAGTVMSGDADHVGAVPYGALPLSTAVALAAGRSLVWPRKSPKGHGTGAMVEGVWSRGQRVALVDDVVTTGSSALQAAEMLRDAGLIVEDLIALVDRGAGAGANLAAAGIRLHAITTLWSLIDDLAVAGLIDTDDHRRVAEYLDR